MPLQLLLAAVLLVGAAPDPVGPVAQAASSVVQVRSAGATGTGFIVEDSVVLTAAHVVSGAEVQLLTDDGRRAQATVRRSASELDVAVLDVQQALPGLTPIPLANSLPELAQDVYAVSAPTNFSTAMISRGVISGITQHGSGEVIQTDAAVNPGSSGGPLLDHEGRAVGLVSSKLEGAEGVAFAVPSAVVAEVLASTDAMVPASAVPLDGRRSGLPGMAVLGVLLGALLLTSFTLARRRQAPAAPSMPDLDITLGAVRTTSAPNNEE